MKARQRTALILVILASFSLISCATTKQPAKGTLEVKSYSEIWLDKRIIQVDFKGGLDEKVDRMKNLAVLRAAELGKERNFERFVILNTRDQTIIDGVLRSGDQLLPIEKLKVSVTIKFVGKDEPEYPQAFDVETKIVDIRNNFK